MIVALNNKSNLKKEEFMDYQQQLNKINSNITLILCASPLNIANCNYINYHLGSQNVSKDNEGAHTGEIAASQLKSYNVEYCLVGHSERRQNQKETNEEIAAKIQKLYEVGIKPILCIGETREERENGIVEKVIEEEIITATKNLSSEEKAELIIAYEPIWSIGTGLIPTNKEIGEILNFIKQLLPNSKILYGGSANEENVDELKQCAEIDGYLLGGLSLKPEKLNIFLQKLQN